MPPKLLIHESCFAAAPCTTRFRQAGTRVGRDGLQPARAPRFCYTDGDLAARPSADRAPPRTKNLRMWGPRSNASWPLFWRNHL